MFRRNFIALATTALSALPLVASAEDYPSQPIKIIVPFGPGGGSDTVARAFQIALEETGALGTNVVVVNMPGAGGSLGGTAVATAEPDGYTLGMWHFGMLTSNALGISQVTPDDIETVALTGRWNSILIARADSGYETLKDLIDYALEHPGEVTEATALGSAPHIQHEMLKSKVDGLDIRLLQSGGGAKRLAAILGGHADVTIHSMGEYVGSPNPDITALVQFSPDRHPAMPDVPTAKELGYDQVWSNYNWVFAPKGTPPERLEILETAFRTAYESESFQAMLAQRALTNEFLTADEAPAVYGPTYEEVKAAAANM
ncbi:tripartite tricarboxylate transporter substrate binding protein [Marinovum sp. 2_MG-2023]|uniref:Bug family tripartite tricarboxylate transporter substrate binding protein n=1 Tax=Roseobacteraceae TaxID=2854170 RepID=UPI001FD4C2D8|nr:MULTISPECIES: tripartite tricarboxylate transporter substrate binding protein [Roseobacteraceae]MCJ7874101.1 tripartite tricarboxylate transporter substrate binding protein [Phaeobacter sp. J2-8]MDO6732546.1 tripartite tricarboxylate transporter substrate binding protein [Marinovum sp. 2_MG-2023]MDO6781822.1 tripartite tricarboxylate transporter substrate binding protein [Marinovum sp. 1_MG-2023]